MPGVHWQRPSLPILAIAVRLAVTGGGERQFQSDGTVEPGREPQASSSAVADSRLALAGWESKAALLLKPGAA